MTPGILEAFTVATTDVFRTMVGREVVAGAPFSAGATECREDLSALIGLSGGLPGTVIVGVDRALAFDFTDRVIGHRTTQIDEEVIDAVGEIANMIVGAAKCSLTRYKLSISLPSVLCGRGLTVNFPSTVKAYCIPFECEGSRLSLRLGLDTTQAAGMAADSGEGLAAAVAPTSTGATQGPVLPLS